METRGEHSVTWKAYLAQLLFEGDQAKAATFCQWLTKGSPNKVLWILDEYEVLDWEVGVRSRKELVVLLEGMGRNSLIVATRPNLKHDFKWDQSFELAPFNAFDVCSFVHLYFAGVRVDVSLIPAKYHGRSLFRRFSQATALPLTSAWSSSLSASETTVSVETVSHLDSLGKLVKTETERQVFQMLSENWALSPELCVPQLLDLLCFAVSANLDGENKPLESGVLAKGFQHDDGGQLNMAFVFQVVLDSMLEQQVWSSKLTAKEARSLLGRLAWKSLEAGPTLSRRDLSRMEGSIAVEEMEAVISKCGLFEMVGHVAKGCYRWKYGVLQDYLAAEFLDSIRHLSEFEVVCRELSSDARMSKTFINSLGSLLSMDLKQSNRVTPNMQGLVRFLLRLKKSPSAKDAGKAVIQCLVKDESLRHFAEELWKQDPPSFAVPWTEFVAAFGDLKLALFIMSIVERLEEDDGFLDWAAIHGNMELLCWLLDEKKLSPTVLLEATYGCGNVAVLKLLFDRGADPTSRFSTGEIKQGQFPFMKMALEYNKRWPFSANVRRWVVDNDAVLEALDFWMGDDPVEDETIAVVELLVEEIRERVSNSQMKLDDAKSLSVLRDALEFAEEFLQPNLYHRLNELLGLRGDENQ